MAAGPANKVDFRDEVPYGILPPRKYACKNTATSEGIMGTEIEAVLWMNGKDTRNTKLHLIILCPLNIST
jgi:hypothetical protein